ncbi:MAG: 2-amino-4-hydroxy-6-hydroxymethyldihydropteridine diphosphokinase [Anaerolineales bacterium]
MDCQESQAGYSQAPGLASHHHKICLSLGSNIDPADNLNSAVELLKEHMTVLGVSRAWRTPAVGTHGPDFLNAAVLVETECPPKILKNEVLYKIEAQLGRVRSKDKYAPRTIDIDIVIYDDCVLDRDLWSYPHLALPVSELLPELVEPFSGRRLETIARELARKSGLSPCPEILECI